jgi:disulfide bond formation protein DsbB
MLNHRQTAVFVFAATLAIIVGAWVFEWAGYLPCDLCLKQRWAYYAVIPISGLLTLTNPSWLKQGLWLCAAIMAGSMIFGIYHAGVEWKFWEGPGTCGAGSLGGGLPDVTKPAVKCDEAAIRIFGLSLAGWNAVLSAAISAVAIRSAISQTRSKVLT